MLKRIGCRMSKEGTIVGLWPTHACVHLSTHIQNHTGKMKPIKIKDFVWI